MKTFHFKINKKKLNEVVEQENEPLEEKGRPHKENNHIGLKNSCNKEKQYIEIIYISSNNIIIKNNIEYKKKLTLNIVIKHLIKNSIFSIDFLEKKYFGCFGKKIDSKFIIKKNDRIEIYDDLKMSPNDNRKFKYKKSIE